MVAILMVVACAVAFMPLLNGQVFAAAKKPAKAKITSFTQATTMETAGQYAITAKWKAAKNAKKYKVIIKEDGKKVYGKTVSKKTKKVTYKAGKIGSKYTVSVQSINGKKKAKAASKSLTVKDKRAEVKSITISSDSLVVGTTFTTAMNPADAQATYQWYRVSGDALVSPIEGATGSTYTAVAADIGSKLTVKATVSGSTTYQDAVVEDTTTGKITTDKKKEALYTEATEAIVGVPIEIVVNTEEAVTFTWKEDGKIVAGVTGNTYTPSTAGVTLTVSAAKADGTAVDIYGPDQKTKVSGFGIVAEKNVAADYDAVIAHKGSDGKTKTGDAEVGDMLTASVVEKADPTKAYDKSDVTYTWSFKYPKDPAAEAIELEDVTTTVNNAVLNLAAANEIAISGDAGVATGKNIAKYNQGGDIKVTATVVSCKDYAGSVSASIKAGTEVPASITLKANTAKLGDTLEVKKVEGNLGSDMTSSVSVTWKTVSLASKTLGTGLTLEVTKSVFDAAGESVLPGTIAAIVDGTDDVSELALVTKTRIDKLELVTDGETMTAGEAPQYKLYDNNDIEVMTATEGTDYTATWYACDARADLWSHPVTTPITSMENGFYYGVKIEPTETGADYFAIAENVYDDAQAVTKRDLKSLTIGIKEDAEATEPFAYGQTLVPVPELPDGVTGDVNATYAWYLDSESDVNLIKEDSELKIDNKDFIGHKILVKATNITAGNTHFKPKEAVTAKEIAKADLAPSITYEGGNPVVGEYAIADVDAGGATYAWYVVKNGGKTPLTADPDVEDGSVLQVPAAAADGNLLVVATPTKAAEAMYNEGSFQDSKVVAAAATTNVYVTITGGNAMGKCQAGDTVGVESDPTDAIKDVAWYYYDGETKVPVGEENTFTLESAYPYDIFAEVTTVDAYGETTVYYTNYLDYNSGVWTLEEPPITGVTATPKSVIGIAASEFYTFDKNDVTFTDSNGNPYTPTTVNVTAREQKEDNAENFMLTSVTWQQPAQLANLNQARRRSNGGTKTTDTVTWTLSVDDFENVPVTLEFSKL